jgi:ATP-binding cassette subfamily F protein 3
LQTEFELLGGFGYENEIKSLLITFGFKESDYNRIIDDFSGGENFKMCVVDIYVLSVV